MTAFHLTDAKTPFNASLAGWWSAWKWVAILAGLLLLSVWFNWWQYRRAITAPLRAELAGKEQALQDSEALQVAARDSALRAIAANDQVAARLEGAGARYREAIPARPLTHDNCAPGQARVDATNQALGAISKEK